MGIYFLFLLQISVSWGRTAKSLVDDREELSSLRHGSLSVRLLRIEVNGISCLKSEFPVTHDNLDGAFDDLVEFLSAVANELTCL